MQTFRTRRTLRFGDCDVSGIAYFPAYLNILNGVNEEFWAHIGFPWHRTIPEDRWATPTVHLRCDFSKPSFFGDELDFELTVERVGQSSVTVHHDIRCGAEKRWSATQVLVASNIDEHGAIPWPAEVREQLMSFVATVEDESEL